MAQRGQPQFNMLNGQKQKKNMWECTFHCNIDTRCKKQSPKAIVEDLIAL